MFTQCPECLTVYKVGASELAAARGNARCAYCNALFDTLSTLSEQLPPEPIDRLTRNEEQGKPPQLALSVFRPNRSGQGALFFDPDDHARGGERNTAPPQFTRTQRSRVRGGNSRWILGSLLLMLVLAAEIAWSERAHWMADARLRPWLDGACARLGCQLPLRRDDELLQLASRDIRPHPSVAGALIISATVHNAADFAQPFPPVQVTLSDLDEKRIAMRRFRADDYVADADTLRKGLAAGANASIVFEVADPGRNAVAFEFSFE